MNINESQASKLLFGVAHGNEAAFAGLYEHTAAHLYAVCLSILGNRDAAEEALQEAYLRIWNAADTYNPQRGSVIAWMVSIARYRALDQVRRRGRRPETGMDDIEEDFLKDDNATPQEFSQLAGDIEALDRCMDDLNQNQRHAIQLAFLKGLTHEEIGARLERPLGSVKSWIRRGLQALKRCLQS